MAKKPTILARIKPKLSQLKASSWFVLRASPSVEYIIGCVNGTFVSIVPKDLKASDRKKADGILDTVRNAGGAGIWVDDDNWDDIYSGLKDLSCDHGKNC